MMLSKILIVDDEEVGRDYLREILTDAGVRTVVARDGVEACRRFDEESPDAVVTDYRMPGCDGVELLRYVKSRRPETPVVLVSAHGEIASAVSAMKEGAEDFLTKPFSPDDVRAALARVEERTRLRAENRHLRDESRGSDDLEAVYRHSPSLTPLLERARRVAKTKATVLIEGETGTGKELLARYVHDKSDRRDAPYVRVNCAALNPSLLESEMFGHERGAFTGAMQRRIGRFELADGGTILLDEIGEMPIELQAKLLRVLEEEEFERVGGSETRAADLRVIATTNRDLASAVEEGTFRSDLYYRLNIVPLTLPALRFRKKDIDPLAHFFLDQYRREHGGRVREVSEEVLELFTAYAWPGNIRELRNVIQRLVILDPAERLEEAHVREWLLGCPAKTDLRHVVGMSLAEVEKEVILRTLDETDQNKTEAAKILGLTARTLFNKLRVYRQDEASDSATSRSDKEETTA